MPGPANRSSWRSRTGEDARLLGETIGVVVLTWVLLGWIFDRPFAQSDGTVQWLPYLRSQLAAGADWTDHLYRFGVVGGSAMHDSAGTLPLVQVCAALGLGATATANVLTIFLQVTIAFFSLQLVRGLVEVWASEPAPLAFPHRVAVIWACAFAPWLGWRLAYGHENLVLGLLPLIACAGLVARARTAMPSPLALVFATFASWNALSGLGAQLITYGLVFGTPLLLVLALEPSSAPRWSRRQLAILCALAAGALLVLPRFAGMLAHVTSDDFPRTGGLTYSFGIEGARDWLGSLPWTTAAARSSPIAMHESNLPIGPLALFLIAWPARRRLLWTLGGVTLVILAFASDLPPISAILGALPPVAAFRVPSRALLVVLILVVPIALAALIARLPRDSAKHAGAVGLVLGVAVVAIGRFSPSLVREMIALAAVAVVVVCARWRPALASRIDAGAWLAVIASLGVGAFDERFPRHLPVDRIEDGPAALREQLVAELPELASPLVRMVILDPPRPYEMSTAFAAGLGSIDGAWYPTRRFLALLSALGGKPVDSTTGIFQLGRTRAFPALQQLYNVRHALIARDGRADLVSLAATPGAAWFPTKVVTIYDAAQLARDLAAGARVHDVAWVLRSDAVSPPACTGAKVVGVTVDERGQDATIDVDSPGPCTLVVAANVVHTLHARAGETELPVFPIDIALVGIEVPGGRASIQLGPRPVLPAWSRIGFIAGLLVLAVAAGLALRERA